MKILFDIRKCTGDRNYAYSLNIQPLILVNGNKKLIGNIRTLNGIPAVRIHSIVKEFKDTGCLTGKNLGIVKHALHNKRITIEELNAEY